MRAISHLGLSKILSLFPDGNRERYNAADANATQVSQIAAALIVDVHDVDIR